MGLKRWWQSLWERLWVPFYCRFAFFHLMRSREDGSFIVVYDRKEPTVEGYYILSSSWTPRGCRRSAETEVWWESLVDIPQWRVVGR